MIALRDDVHGHDSWCSLNEGLGKVLRYGAYGPEVIERLRWMNAVLGPILGPSRIEEGIRTGWITPPARAAVLAPVARASSHRSVLDTIAEDRGE